MQELLPVLKILDQIFQILDINFNIRRLNNCLLGNISFKLLSSYRNPFNSLFCSDLQLTVSFYSALGIFKAKRFQDKFSILTPFSSQTPFFCQSYILYGLRSYHIRNSFTLSNISLYGPKNFIPFKNL